MQNKNILFSFVFIFSLSSSLLMSDSLFYINHNAYAQIQSKDKSTSSNFLNYYNPSVMMKIKYPEFWHKPVVINNDTIAFSSPVKTIGVIFQVKSVLNMSKDEISMNTIKDIENTFSNVKILNFN